MSSTARDDAIRELPRAHALALRLRNAGVSEEVIAECLEIDPASVRPLLALAEEKLNSIVSRGGHDRD
jgi:hypothetical protein